MAEMAELFSACTADDERNTDCGSCLNDHKSNHKVQRSKFNDQSSMIKVQRSKDSAPAEKKDKPPL
jgi:hypothetical protein